LRTIPSVAMIAAAMVAKREERKAAISCCIIGN
jgi:hypothetical protein